MSAYVIEDHLYNKFANCLQAIWDTPILKRDLLHPVEYFIYEHHNGLKESHSVAVFVHQMFTMNAESVAYRYDEEPQPVQPGGFKPVPDFKFAAYAKPFDWVELAGFLRCWDYQSCEVPEEKQTPRQKAILHACKSLRIAFLEKAIGKQSSWGKLELSMDNEPGEVVCLTSKLKRAGL